MNTEAEVRIPKLKFENIILKEGGKQIFDGVKFLTGIQGIQMVEETQRAVVIKIGSGHYFFEMMED